MSGLRQFWALTQFSVAVAVRLRAGWLIAGGAVALVAGGAVLRELHFGSAEAGFLIDYAKGVLALGGALLAALVGPAVFFEGLRARTTDVLLLHGVRRGAITSAQIAATTVALGGLVVLCAVGAAALLGGLGHGALVGAALAAVARETGPLLVLAAASVFFASLTRSEVLAAALTLGLAFGAHLVAVAGRASAQASGIAQAGWTLLGWLVPNFGATNSAAPALAVGYFVAYACVYGALAAWVFSRRDL